jgi:hypothetical protein
MPLVSVIKNFVNIAVLYFDNMVGKFSKTRYIFWVLKLQNSYNASASVKVPVSCTVA